MTLANQPNLTPDNPTVIARAVLVAVVGLVMIRSSYLLLSSMFGERRD
jgi:hypothetical protein